MAAVGNENLSPGQQTWSESRYQLLTYVLNVATAPGFLIDEAVLNAMHFMLLEHDLTKNPGRYRSGPVHVHDDRTGRTVYEGPDPDLVPMLMRDLAKDIRGRWSSEPLVRAAMATRLVMIPRARLQ